MQLIPEHDCEAKSLSLYRLADSGEVFWIAAHVPGEALSILVETVGSDAPEDVEISTVTQEEAATIFVREDFEMPRQPLSKAFSDCTSPQYIAGTVE